MEEPAEARSCELYSDKVFPAGLMIADVDDLTLGSELGFLFFAPDASL
jgi:hypothetical protein